MSTSTKAMSFAIAALMTALAVGGCGGEDSESVARTDGGRAGRAATAPQSAGDKRPPAPDDAISERPGGPGGGPELPSSGSTRPASAGDGRRIEQTVRRYVAALNADDGRGLCRLLAPAALQEVELPVHRGSCAASLRASIGHPPPGGAPRWLGTRVVDADSIVLVRGGDGRFTGTVVHRFAAAREPSIEDDVIYLRRVAGAWRLAKPSASFYRAIGARDVPITALTPPR